MELSDRYIAPPVDLKHVTNDEEWLENNFKKFVEFMYSEYPHFGEIAEAGPKSYLSVAREWALPQFKVGIIDGEHLRKKKYGKIRVVYVDDGEKAYPLYFIAGEQFYCV